jgi:hypothetical protein
MISPCLCAGTLRYICTGCINKKQQNQLRCELCNTDYAHVVETPLLVRVLRPVVTAGVAFLSFLFLLFIAAHFFITSLTFTRSMLDLLPVAPGTVYIDGFVETLLVYIGATVIITVRTDLDYGSSFPDGVVATRTFL